jgi:general secretion pathway protein M
MNLEHTIARFLIRSPSIATAAYLALIGTLSAVAWISIGDIFDRRAELARTEDVLNQLSRTRNSTDPTSAGSQPSGSPFLEGPTVTVAGAALLQRVAGAVTKVGGSVQSSQVNVTGIEAKDGFVSLTMSCEFEQAALQRVLYDIEAGMPFLFVDQLDVQAPQTAAVSEGNVRLHVLLGISGQWKAAPK